MDINELVSKHGEWHTQDGHRYPSFCFSDLSGMDLCGIDFSGANLHYATLDGTSLDGAILVNTNLSSAQMRGTSLTDANLSGANLACANMFKANLSRANLSGVFARNTDFVCANLSGVNLSGANLWHAWLSNANIDRIIVDEDTQHFDMHCPTNGEFTGWKKVYYQGAPYIIELRIPTEARRSSATSNKCRCEYAKVIQITRPDGSTTDLDNICYYGYLNNHDCRKKLTSYQVGEMVYPDSWDDDRWRECTHGIHFFMTRDEAMRHA